MTARAPIVMNAGRPQQLQSADGLSGRIQPRVQTVASSATVTPNADADDEVVITAQGQAVTFANPSGTPVSQQKLLIQIKDDGTARGITFGSQYRAMGVALPTTTTLGKWLLIGCKWYAADSKWNVVVAQNEA